jgi:lipopolysaccharide/colanic/teichoic acid biosynthesis glycosyltransferase
VLTHVVQTRRGLVTKRAFDVVVGTLLAVVTIPIVVVMAIGSAWSFRAWPFFTQPRVGRRGRTFTFVKVRSLPVSTPPAADKYALQHVSTNRFGRLLRNTHLDELPQLWLVVAGKMSLVGPRPEMPKLAKSFDPAFAHLRQRVRPGCTGLWQLSSDASGLIHESPKYDRFYLSYQTWRMDLWVLVRTVWRMLGARPVDLDDVPRWTLAKRVAGRSVPVASEPVSVPATGP